MAGSSAGPGCGIGHGDSSFTVRRDTPLVLNTSAMDAGTAVTISLE